MGKPSPPPAPDYVGAAQAQGMANKDAAIATASLGNPNINSPYGNQTVTYANTGPDGNSQPTVNQTLTPQAQQTLDAQQRVQYALANLGQQGIGQAQGVLGQSFNPNLPDLQTSVGTSPIDTSGIAKMPVNAGTTGQAAILARLQPQIDQRDKALRQTLANQGLVPGGEAYTNAMRDENSGNNDLYNAAAVSGLNLDMGANQQGYAQAVNTSAQNYGQNLGATQFGNQALAQSLAQKLGLYNQPLNQITALMSGSQIQNPQFANYQGANIGAAPIANATSQQAQYQQGLYGQQMAGYNSTLGGLGQLAGLGAAGLFAA